MQPIAVCETNILLSGLGWKGTPYRCIELARQRNPVGESLMRSPDIEGKIKELFGERLLK